ncbi:MAG: hypothetical protein OXN84_12305 [Albidovulum sp.]|nr:hypothetical protein [Albidovulum sp.]
MPEAELRELREAREILGGAPRDGRGSGGLPREQPLANGLYEAPRRRPPGRVRRGRGGPAGEWSAPEPTRSWRCAVESNTFDDFREIWAEEKKTA